MNITYFECIVVCECASTIPPHDKQKVSANRAISSCYLTEPDWEQVIKLTEEHVKRDLFEWTLAHDYWPIALPTLRWQEWGKYGPVSWTPCRPDGGLF